MRLGVARALRFAALIAALCLPRQAWALDNGLARTPPMGFNTWNRFACNISEQLVEETADKMVELGLVTAGYTFLNIDDCWSLKARSAAGALVADPARFPSGLAALAARLNARGLRLGLYADSGLLTCAGYPGSGGHERADARQFAAWGVDYLKYDNCFAPNDDAAAVRARYERMRDALNATGRPIVYSMCEWGVADPWAWAAAVANSYRTEQDIAPAWDAVLRCLDNGAAGLARFAGPGAWNDPDMLEIGNGALTPAQQRAHLALWALVKAPLLLGTDLRSASETTLAVARAAEVLAVSQDALGVAGDVIWKQGPREVWAAPLAGGARAVVLFNRRRDGAPAAVRVEWAWLGLAPGRACRVRDLFERRDLGASVRGGFSADVPDTGVVALRVTPEAPEPGDDAWRPWHDGAAAALQARARERGRAARLARLARSRLRGAQV